MIKNASAFSAILLFNSYDIYRLSQLIINTCLDIRSSGKHESISREYCPYIRLHYIMPITWRLRVTFEV